MENLDLERIDGIWYELYDDYVQVYVRDHRSHSPYDRHRIKQLSISVLHYIQTMINLREISISDYRSYEEELDPDLFSGLRNIRSVFLDSVTTDLVSLLEPVTASLSKLVLKNINIDPLGRMSIPLLTELTIEQCTYTLYDALYLDGYEQLTSVTISDTELGLLPQFEYCTLLEDIRLIRCNMSDDDVTTVDWSRLQEIRVLIISDCNLYGELNETFGYKQYLYYLDLSKNRLFGQLSVSMVRLPSLQVVSLSDNQFSGYLYPLTSTDSLVTLEIYRTNIKGPIPSEMIVNNKYLTTIIATDTLITSLPNVYSPSQELRVSVDNDVQRNSKYWRKVPYDHRYYSEYINRGSSRYKEKNSNIYIYNGQ